MYNTFFHALKKSGWLTKMLPLFAVLLFVGTLPVRTDGTARQKDADGYYRLETAQDLQWFADIVYDGD